MNMISMQINIPQDMSKLKNENFSRQSSGNSWYLKLDLIEYYNSMGLSYLNQSEEELSEELETFRKLKENNSCF